MSKSKHWTPDGKTALCGSKSKDFTFTVRGEGFADAVCFRCTKQSRAALWEGWAKLATSVALAALIEELTFEKTYATGNLRATTGSTGPLRILLALYRSHAEQRVPMAVLEQVRVLLSDAIAQALKLAEQHTQQAREAENTVLMIVREVDELRDLFTTTRITQIPSA